MEPNQLKFVTMIVGLLVALNGSFLWAVKWLLDRSQKRIDEKFDDLTELHAAALERIENTEKDLLRMREELAREYVRRDDWIRFSTTIMAKLDAVWAAIDALKERLHVRDRSSSGSA